MIKNHRRTLIYIGALLALTGCQKDAALRPGTPENEEAVASFYSGIVAVEAGTDALGEERLMRVTALAPTEAAAWANLGLIALRQNDLDRAAPLLERALEEAPDDPRILFIIGQWKRIEGSDEEAAQLFEKAIRIDADAVSSAYTLAQIREMEGDLDGAASLLSGILDTRPNNLAATLESARLAIAAGDEAYLREMVSRMEPSLPFWPEEAVKQYATLSEAAAEGNIGAAASAAAFLKNLLLRYPAFRQSLLDLQPAVDAISPLLAAPTALPQPDSPVAAPDSTLAFEPGQILEGNWERAQAIVADSDSYPTPVAIKAGEVLLTGAENRNLASAGDAPRLVALDYNYDFRTDFAVVSNTVQLFSADSLAGYVDVTASSMLGSVAIPGGATNVWSVDLDQEGDMDLVIASTAAPLMVFQNGGSGAFAPIELFQSSGPGVLDFAWADFDSDGDGDAAILEHNGRLSLHVNRRGGRFDRLPVEGVSDAVAIAVTTLDRDALLDLAVLKADGSVVGVSWEDPLLPETAQILGPGTSPSTPDAAPALFVGDFDNNGAPDLMTTAGDRSTVYLKNATGGYEQVLHIENHHVVDVADLSGDGRLDLLAIDGTGRVVTLVNRGTAPYGWVQLRPRAATTFGDQRINSFGLGGEIEIRSGLQYQKVSIASPLVHAGLGNQKSVDVARIIWPNGSIQAEFDLLSDVVVNAQQRLKGSCPWLYTYDGEEMAFVTDFIWRSPLGLKINAQETAGMATTEDWVKIRGDQLKARDGIYDVRITADLWETHFFDHVSLLVVDHPEDTEVLIDERFVFPSPAYEVQVFSQLRPIRQVTTDQGEDVTDLVTERDARYLDFFGRGAYQGITRDHWIEVDLGAKAPESGQPVLVGNGWVRPTDSSINVAIAQGGVVSPNGIRLEIPDGNGSWRVVRENLGFPSGKLKTVLIDLAGLFEAGEEMKVRLGTNLEIYWDEWRWGERAEGVAIKTRRLQAVEAELRYRGYSKTVEADKSSPELGVYGELMGTAPIWRDLVGYYTRFGEVDELVAEVDDRYVIMNAGDELALQYPEVDPPEAGWIRDYVMIGDGWVKDGDYNTTESKTVLPLPSHADVIYEGRAGELEDDPVYRRHAEDWQRYHTRYVGTERFVSSLVPRR